MAMKPPSNPGWHIRRMSEADIAPIARLRHAAFFEGTARTVADDAEGLRDLLANDSRQVALVALSGNIPIGTCLLVTRELEPAHDLTPWLAGLVVSPDFRSRGVGAALVAGIEACARDLGFDRLHLYTDAAEPFYAKRGWVVADRFPADGKASVLMIRRLT